MEGPVSGNRTKQDTYLCQSSLCWSRTGCMSRGHGSHSGLRSVCRWGLEKSSPSSASFFSLVSSKCSFTLPTQPQGHAVTGQSMASRDYVCRFATTPVQGSPQSPGGDPEGKTRAGRGAGKQCLPQSLPCFGSWDRAPVLPGRPACLLCGPHCTFPLTAWAHTPLGQYVAAARAESEDPSWRCICWWA